MDRIQSMEVFTRVVDTGSFTKAADTLQLARPVVTRAIQDLERRLGVRLINRTTRRLNLTEEGRTYYDMAVRILRAVDESEATFATSNATPKGTLKIDVQRSIARNVLVPNLADFRERYPHIELIIGTGDRPVDLIEEGVDCALRVGLLEDSSMIARQVGTFERVTVASRDYMARVGVLKELDDLSAHRAVHYIAGKGARPPFFEFDTPDGGINVRMLSSVQVNDADTYIELAKAGFGIIQPSRYSVRRELASGELIEVLPQFPVPPRPISVIFPQSRHLAPKLRAFVSWVTEVFESSPMAIAKRSSS